MANLKLYPHGITAGIPGTPPTTRGIKQQLSGWSRSSCRSLVRFLYSLDVTSNFSPGSIVVSYTFTVSSCPEAPDDWARVRQVFFRSLNHRSVSTFLWLTEWQARGVPHLHGIIILSADAPTDIIGLWCRAAQRYGARQHCQTVREIYNPVGWMEYLGKHSQRGLSHYQRSYHNIPAAWQSRTGRMWGYRGDWARAEPIPLGMDRGTFYRLRRVLRNRCISEARSRHDPKAIRLSRASLKCSDQFLSSRRGISQFVPQTVILTTLENLNLQPNARISS